MATLTVATALPVPEVNRSSGSAVKRPVMVTVFMVVPFLRVAGEKRRVPADGDRRTTGAGRKGHRQTTTGPLGESGPVGMRIDRSP
jgi:hypothetical protein